MEFCGGFNRVLMPNVRFGEREEGVAEGAELFAGGFSEAAEPESRLVVGAAGFPDVSSDVPYVLVKWKVDTKGRKLVACKPDVVAQSGFGRRVFRAAGRR